MENFKKRLIESFKYCNVCYTLLNRIPSVQECDATMFNSSNADWLTIKNGNYTKHNILGT